MKRPSTPSPVPAQQPSLLAVWISNLKERILFWLFSFINRHHRYVLIEGDTTELDEHGDWPVSNAAVNISHCMANEIFRDSKPYEGDAFPDRFYTLTYMVREMAGRHKLNHFCFSVCPDMDLYDQRPILSPILYDARWHTYGFQPCTPTVTMMLHHWHVPVRSAVVLPIIRRYDYTNSCYEYRITNPDERILGYGLIERLILRNTFRFPDKRTIKK